MISNGRLTYTNFFQNLFEKHLLFFELSFKVNIFCKRAIFTGFLNIYLDIIIFFSQVQGQTPSPPFPAPSCSIQTKPGQCSLQMGSFCDCDQNNVRCSHDGECPGSEFAPSSHPNSLHSYWIPIYHKTHLKILYLI